MPLSEARKRANKKYNDAHYQSVSIRIRKEKRVIIDEYAKKSGMTVASFCRSCIEYCIENDIDVTKRSGAD